MNIEQRFWEVISILEDLKESSFSPGLGTVIGVWTAG